MTLLESILCRPCIFCEIVNGNIPDKLIYKDNDMAAFYDINPAAETHILVVPVAHIESVKTITLEHSDLLEKMRQKGIELLKEHGHDPESSRLGFHVPPFNTVSHLHLHVIGGTMKSRFRKLKYETGRMWYKDMVQLQAEVEMQRRAHGSRL